MLFKKIFLGLLLSSSLALSLETYSDGKPIYEPIDVTITPIDVTVEPMDVTITPIDVTVEPMDVTITPIDVTVYPINNGDNNSSDDNDNDGINNDTDNCKDIANANQLDFDKDGIGDVCDEDDDNDGISDKDEIKAGTNPKDKNDYPVEINSVDTDEIPDSLETNISKLYVAIFNRASEGSGNKYWQNQGTMEEIANSMLNTYDAKEYFGDNLNSNQAFIEWIYKNTLNKDYFQDPEGIEYWTKELDNGASRGSVVVNLINAIDTYKDATDSVTKKAYNQFINRVKISNYMAEHVYDVPSDYKISTSFNNGLKVGSDINDINIAKALINNFR